MHIIPHPQKTTLTITLLLMMTGIMINTKTSNTKISFLQITIKICLIKRFQFFIFITTWAANYWNTSMIAVVFFDVVGFAVAAGFEDLKLAVVGFVIVVRLG